jgi:hypothetical protein
VGEPRAEDNVVTAIGLPIEDVRMNEARLFAVDPSRGK